MQYKMNDKLKFYANTNNNSNTVTEIPFLSFFQNKNKTIEFDYTGHSQTIELLPGKYKIECYGSKDKENFSSYVSGEIELKIPTRIYVYIGEAELSNLPYAFNGGGVTDIRLRGGSWNSEESLKSRIMIADGKDGESNFINVYNNNLNVININQPMPYSRVYFTNPSMTPESTIDTSGQGKVIITFLEDNYSSILIKDNEKIKQVNNNNILTVLKNKNINNLEFKDFYYTDRGNEISRERLENNKIKILSIKDYFKYKILEGEKFYTVISNKDVLKIYDIFNVKKIKIEDIGQIKYLIYNGKNYYTWVDDELAIYGDQDRINTNPEYMYKIGMSSDIINNFTEKDWNKIFTKAASAKYIRFIAILEYNSNTEIKKIEMTKDAFPYNIDLYADSYDEIMYTKKDVITLKEQYNKIRILYSV